MLTAVTALFNALTAFFQWRVADGQRAAKFDEYNFAKARQTDANALRDAIDAAEALHTPAGDARAQRLRDDAAALSGVVSATGYAPPSQRPADSHP